MDLTVFFRKLIALTPFIVLSFSVLGHFSKDSANYNLNSNKIGSYRTFESLNAKAFAPGLVETDVFSQKAFKDTTITGNIANLRARADAVFEKVESLQNYVDYLDETSLLELPVGIKKTIGNVDYTIMIDSVKLRMDGTYLTAYMKLDLPSDDQSIAFRGSGIKFSKYGGIDVNARLELIGDYSIDFNDHTALILKGEGDTFVNFDCDGFQGMGISADVVFSRDFIVPDTPGGTPGEGRVTSSFTTSLIDWNDFLVELSIPDFQVNGVEGLGFSVNNAVFDFSDYRNAASVVFPDNYLSSTGHSENTDTWRGFYMKHLRIALPPHFKKSESSERVAFQASNMIIDRSGFTGLLEAENLIQLSEGDISGWAFSLDRIHVEFLSSQIQSGGFEGEIVVPVAEESKSFNYTAVISNDNTYELSVVTTETMQFPMFSTSEVKLFPNTSVEIVLDNGKFLPKANLYGEMNISSDIGQKELNLANIEFQNLQIQTVKPYLSADYFSFGSEAAQQAMAGFPIQIEKIGFRNIDDELVALDVGVEVNITESFAGNSEIAIIGKQRKERVIKWQLHDVEVNKIAIDVETAAFGFKGQLAFYRNDAIYGDGFNGQVEASFKSLNLVVESGAIFGSVDGFRYWYVDAAVSLPTGIPIGPGIEITGFGGGAYEKMAMDTEGVGSELGSTRSGIVYVPKKDNGLGLKASVTFATSGGGAFNGEAAFEIAFFSGGGIRYTSFKGNAYFMTAPLGSTLTALKDKATQLANTVSKLEKAAGYIPGSGLIAENNEEDQTLTKIYGEIGKAGGERGALSAHVFILLDFENSSLYGNFEVFINVAGGIIKGVGEDGRAGWAELYFGPDDWYIYVGTPTDRIGISAGIGPIRASLTSYFMLGTSIPGSPPPPDEVSEILGGIDLDYMSKLNELGNGAGIGFGASFSMDTGDLTFLMFYARFKAGAGFDVMLKDYGNAVCEGSGQIGINGWYANGQAYAYFDGTIGIKVKVFGFKKKIKILSLGAAAIMQSKLPNPFWMRGTVGGRYSVLGGLVSGYCSFQVTIGKECELVDDRSVVESIKVLADLSPVSGSSDVSVFTTPQAVFNLPVNQEFEMMDLNEKPIKFRAKIDFFTTKEGEYSLTGDYQLNFDKNVAAFNAHDIFPPQKQLTTEVQISFEEYKDGRWQAVIVDGKKYTEYMETSFKTGNAPDHIPLSNVAYSYPVVDQLNFYKDQYLSGYIGLKKGQPYLFEASSEWDRKGRFINLSNGDTKYFDFAYASGTKEVAFNLPKNMVNDQIYAFELVNLPANDTGEIDRNIQVDSLQVSDGNATIVSRRAEGAIAELQEKSIFSTHFRTSKYTTFESKVRAQKITRTSREIAFLWEGLFINNQILTDEPFAHEELAGNEYTHPMVRLVADTDGNEYFEKYINPLIYNGYPLDGDIRITNRSVDVLGVVPVRAVWFRQNDDNLKLSEDYISIGRYTFMEQSMNMQYLPAPYMYFDFIDLQAQVAKRFIDTNEYPDRISRLIWGQFPVHTQGVYNINAEYYLPGKASPNDIIKINTVYNQD